MLSGLWKEWVGDGEGEVALAAQGDLALFGDGAKPTPFCDAGGRFFIVVMAKGEIASAIACVLMGSSSSGSGLMVLPSAAPDGRPLAVGVMSVLEDLDFLGLLCGDVGTLNFTGDMISSLKER